MIKHTTDYSLFIVHEKNRPILKNHLETLINKIKKKNLLPFRPINVDRDMRVIDGQHRLAAAQKLRLPIYYIIGDTHKDEDMIDLNNAQRMWKLENYVEYFISCGNQEYVKLKEYVNKYGITYNVFTHFPIYQRRSLTGIIKSGTFVFMKKADQEKIDVTLENVIKTIEAIKNYCLAISKINFATIKAALIQLFLNPDVNIEIMIENIKTKGTSIRPCHGIYSNYAMMRDIYNYRNPNPVD